MLCKLQKKINNFLLLLITIYQYSISPFLPPCCRFYPSCSNYAKSVIKSFGLFKGCWLTFLRILRCNPFCKGGFDPVPENKKRLKND